MRSLLLVVLLGAFSTGCFIDNRPRHRTASSHSHRGCGPSHHWNGNACVHNGKAKGHYKRGR
jgi:hypothetical protein